MERKIGEIFEYNGEWYQCIRSILTCSSCEIPRPCTKIRELGCCSPNMRNDKEQVIFKKLEKVGEPYFNGQYGEVLQEYKYYIPPITPDLRIHIIKLGIVGIEIKQNKEDMEEGKLDPHMEKVIDEAAQKMGEEIGRQIEANINKQKMKPFDLEAAKAGKPVCTRDGRKARIICFDAKGDKSIIALVEMGVAETPNNYPIDGKAISTKETPCDLMMLPEKKEGWINIYNADTTFYYADGRVFETKDEAVQEAKEEVEKEQREKNEYIDTIRVEWEE